MNFINTYFKPVTNKLKQQLENQRQFVEAEISIAKRQEEKLSFEAQQRAELAQNIAKERQEKNQRQKKRKAMKQAERRARKKAAAANDNETGEEEDNDEETKEEENADLTMDEVLGEIDRLGERAMTAEADQEMEAATKKTWKSRPLHWIDIVEFYHRRNKDHVRTILEFQDDFKHYKNEESKIRTIRRWSKDWQAGKLIIKQHKDGQAPDYGREVDIKVKNDIQARIDVGLLVDDVILKECVLIQLRENNLNHLLKVNGGRLMIGHGWCARFWKRHNFVSRIATTKMRDTPADFAIKEQAYLDVAVAYFKEHDIPPELVIGCDETNVYFVSRAKKTRSNKGQKRIRLIGVGDNDKAQITCTLFVTAAGDVLSHQLIFKGKTKACHPKHVQPTDCLFAHTESHWQSPKTYKEVIEKIIVPYKNAKIAQLGLPVTQWSVLKHDLHYSHKDPEVLALLAMHFIKPLFVPACCTDIMQECDTVLNKPFKNGAKNGFRDHIHNLLLTHIANGNAIKDFKPLMTIGALKPHICKFVRAGILAITTPDMKETIQKAFKEDGRFDIIRQRAAAERAAEQTAAQAAAQAAAQPALVLTFVPAEEIRDDDEESHHLNLDDSEDEGFESDDEEGEGEERALVFNLRGIRLQEGVAGQENLDQI